MAQLKTTAKKSLKRSPSSDDKMLSMHQAMTYLSDKGIPCRSRNNFYKIIDDFKIPYVNTNPKGRYEVRRFALSALNDFLITQGLEP